MSGLVVKTNMKRFMLGLCIIVSLQESLVSAGNGETQFNQLLCGGLAKALKAVGIDPGNVDIYLVDSHAITKT